jgi:ABC-2 type transport system permease protein
VSQRIRGLKVAWRLTKCNFKATLEYRADFLLAIVSGIIWQASVLVFATVLINRFPGLGGWSKGDVLLITSIRLMSHGLYIAIFVELTGLPRAVQEGRVESYLLRPMPVYRQILLNRVHFNAIGDLAVAITLFAIAIPAMSVHWSTPKIAYLSSAVVGGMFLEASFHTLVARFALRSIPTSPWSQWIDEILATFGGYPIIIMPGALKLLLTYIAPVAFVAYVPAAVVAGRDAFLVPGWLALSAPLIGLVAFFGAKRFFYRGLRHYTGIGG